MMNSYDQAPYPAFYFPETHPDRLAMIGTLLGLNPPPVTTCRVLEIGCGVGTNLMGMAYALPDSNFTGIDLSGEHIRIAQEEQAALGLNNIAFYQMDLQDLPSDFGVFDYIIAHGVYSWVAPEIRSALLRVCAQHLAPNGIAYISYNVYPGWYLKRAAREIAQFHTQGDTPESAYAAETLLYTLAQASAQQQNKNQDGHLFAAVLDESHRRYQTFLEIGASLLMHDDLNPRNDPVYFQQFVAHAAQYGLAYLAESDLRLITHNDFPLEMLTEIDRLATVQDEAIEPRDHLLRFEQYMDFARGRAFRKSLLIHADTPGSLFLQSEQVKYLHATIGKHEPRLESDPDQPGIFRLTNSTGNAYVLDAPITIAAVEYLSGCAPAVIPVSMLFEIAFEKIQIEYVGEEEAHMERLCADLMNIACFDERLLRLHAHIPRYATIPDNAPLASALARRVAAKGEAVPNFLNERYMLTEEGAALVALLDGQHSREMLMGMLRISDPIRLNALLLSLVRIGIIEET